MVELRTGAQPTNARHVLEDLKRELSNIRGTAPSPEARLREWRKWSSLAPARARAHLTDRSIRQTVLGPQFALLHNIDASNYGPGLNFILDAEIDTRLEELDQAIKQIDDTIRLWGHSSIAVILDTNVVLAAGPRVAKISWDDVLNEITRKAAFVVPIQVVEELDRLKDRGNPEPRSNARFALKWLSELLDSGNTPRSFQVETSKESEATIQVWVDDNDRVPLAEVDRDIIDCALQLQPFTKKTVIASMDRSMVFRTRAYGLSAVLLTDDDIPERTNPVKDE
jgi:hypothetical protein